MFTALTKGALDKASGTAINFPGRCSISKSNVSSSTRLRRQLSAWFLWGKEICEGLMVSNDFKRRPFKMHSKFL